MQNPYIVVIAAAVVVIAVALSVLVAFLYGRRRAAGRNLDMSLDAGVRRLLDDFLAEFAGRARWDAESGDRLRAAGEEVLLSLARADGPDAAGLRRLRVSARLAKGSAVLEFLAAPQGANLEEQITRLKEHAPPSDGSELSLRLLEHYAESVTHRHYHLNDLMTVKVRGPER